MRSIKDDFINLREKHDLSISCISTKTGINQDVLYEFTDSGSIGFKHLVTLSKFFHKEQYHEIMRDWCMKIESPEWLKQAFEYAALKRDSKLLAMLLEKNKEESGVKQFVEMYSILLDFMTDRINFDELCKNVKNQKVSSSKDLAVLRDIYICVSLYYEGDFLGMARIANDINNAVKKIGKRRAFFRESFSYRLSELLAPAYLHLNDLELCREHAQVLVETELNYKHISDGYYYLGMCNLYEDKGACVDFLIKSVDYAKMTNEDVLISEAMNNLNFVKTLFDFLSGGKLPDLTKLTDKLLLGGDEDFIVYFNYVKGRELGDIYKAFSHFHKEMNFFFASLAAETLRIVGVDPNQVKALKEIKLKTKGAVVYEKDFINGFCFRGISSFAS
ncbi:AimR family lysis-lysogeny pheromone receptor [Bacillus altitudinis]|uniref:AimR family lysis-lysogeny pheromone receptor n=1 Tax=Bacillus altitudinis TaxID=293387 RepID=UPI00119D199E|nr:AimR family lysis-lysogeny pheromone receptor [Bacillus altitudinis]